MEVMNTFGNERPQAERAREVDALFFRNYGSILDAALSNRQIMVADGYKIAGSIEQHLNQYQGPLNDESFESWAKELAESAAIKMAKFYEILETDGWAIRAGIASALGIKTRKLNQFDDSLAVAEELYSEVALLVFQRLDGFLRPGRAKLSTCLFALAHRHATSYYVVKQARRHDAVRRRLEKGGGFDMPEVLTDAELDFLKAEESQETLIH